MIGERNNAADKHPETPLFRTLHAIGGTLAGAYT